MDKVLLGATKNGEIVFAEIDNDRDYFSVSFDSVNPLNLENFDLVGFCEDCYDRYNLGDDAYCDLLERFDCAPSELASYISDNSPIDEILDLSLFPDHYFIHGDEWVFESSGCGQSSDYDYMENYVDKNASDIIVDYWKKYHLKQLPEECKDKLKESIDRLYKVDEAHWICKYIDDKEYGECNYD